MNNLLSYCGLIDVRINASDKDLPVLTTYGFYKLRLVRGLPCTGVPVSYTNER